MFPYALCRKDLVPPLDPARAIRRWMTHSHCDHTSSYVRRRTLTAIDMMRECVVMCFCSAVCVLCCVCAVCDVCVLYV